MKEKEKLNTQFTFRIYNADNALRFNKFQNELKNNGISLSTALENIINDYLEKREKIKIFKDLKSDMEYSFHKAIHARMLPFSNSIVSKIIENRAELSIINKKLDILLNAICGDNNLSKELLNNPTLDFLKESKYFEETRKMLNLENQMNIEKKNKKIEKIVKREKVFEDYNFNNDTDFGEEYEPINNKGDLYEKISE